MSVTSQPVRLAAAPAIRLEKRVTTSVCEPVLALPEYSVQQDEIIEALLQRYCDLPLIDEVASHVRACRVDTRRFVLPLEEVMQERTFGERNQIYSQEAVRLGLEAADGALRAAHVTAEEIDALVFVSCTGYMLPGPDAYIANQLGCKPTVSRTPIQQLGCAAGATALAKAHDYLVGRPEATALVIAVELSSLSYQASKRSMSDFISNALFGDAAAAVVVKSHAPRQLPAAPGFEVEASMQHLLPGSTSLIYGETSEIGFHFWTNPGARRVVAKIAPALVSFVSAHGWRPSELSFCVSHTGGPLIMDAVEECLGLPAGTVDPSRASLAQLGNCSSVSVLDVLRRHHHRPPADGERGMVIAFGPGFTTEALLGRWRGGAVSPDVGA